ncbi:MAG: tyrosine-type recombinase/integrase, partial [Solirubrobacteraceae bacterium]
KGEAVRVAHELKGNWKHRRPGVYRVTPEGMRQPRRVSRATAQTLEAQGWIVKVRRTRHWVELRAPSINNYNKHRTVLNSAFLWAIRRGYIEHNPMAEVPRRSTKAEQQRILTREDFYTPEQVQLLLQFAPSIREEACWLCGAHAGLRLPGEALGLKWGMVDFKTEVIRPYGNWVLNEDDTTKTPNFTPIPMTPRLIRTLKALKQRRHDTGENDYVFAGEGGRPMSGERLRERFVGAVAEAGLPRIPMYNLRHSFGTALAADGVPIRTIQALMRHSRIGTTEKYMAYAPQPELAGRIASALEPKPTTAEANASQAPVSEFLQKLEEEIPAKWLREVERIFAEGHMPLPTEDVTELPDGDHKLRGALAVIDTAIS